MILLVSPGGEVRCLYGEAIDLDELGRLTITRGSHVEPDAAGRWFADMAPVQGPKLGPFHQRSDALAAEVSWLEEHWLIAGGIDEKRRGTEHCGDDVNPQGNTAILWLDGDEQGLFADPDKEWDPDALDYIADAAVVLKPVALARLER